MSCKFVKELVNFFPMFLGIVGSGNYGIVHVDMKPSLGNFILEDFIHYHLEGGGQVC